jgi:prephenate dehydrogenase
MSARTVVISGLGLMGGSLAGALTAAGWRVLLHHRRPEVAATAARLGWGTAVAGLGAAAAADIAVVCTPVLAIAEQVRELARHGARVITDVGSTKAALVAALGDLAATYVGSHPMAGSHLQGLGHADPRLYRGRLTIVTPTPATPAPALALVEELWRDAGCRLLRLDARLHDRAVAEASHLPHILASAAAAQLGAEAAPVAANGFRDATRIAGGSPALWAEILLSNAEAIGEGLARSADRLAALRAALAVGDRPAVERWLEEGRAGRARFERAQDALRPPGEPQEPDGPRLPPTAGA